MNSIQTKLETIIRTAKQFHETVATADGETLKKHAQLLKKLFDAIPSTYFFKINKLHFFR